MFFSFSIFKKEISGFNISIFQVGNKIQTIFKNKDNLIQKNKSLLGKISEVENSIDLLNFYKIENDKLKKELNYQDIYNEKKLVFNVFDYSENFIFNYFLINDFEEKLKIGDLVFSKYNILIGEVSERIGENVKVNLYSKSGIVNEFFLVDGGENLLKVKAVGEGGGILKVEAPRGITFKNPDKVFLVDIMNPSYLAAIKIDEEFEVQNVNNIIYFKLLVNPYLLNQVEVLNIKNEVDEK